MMGQNQQYSYQDRLGRRSTVAPHDGDDGAQWSELAGMGLGQGEMGWKRRTGTDGNCDWGDLDVPCKSNKVRGSSAE